MKKVLVTVGVLALVGAAAIIVVALRAAAKFEPYAERLLLACRDGKYEEVYRDASDGFRSTVPFDEFRDYMEGRRRALGTFQRIVERTGGGASTSSEHGSRGSVSLRLAYEKGEADGEFTFAQQGDDWRLLGAKITFDERLLPKADRDALEPLARELFDLYGASQFTALYERFSRPLKEVWKAETYEPQIRDLFAKSGPVEGASLQETKDEAGERVRQRFDLTFARGPGDASLEWTWDGMRWQLVAFNLHLEGTKR